ncbi:MAG TPA: hypothetical protein VIK33_16515 [Anaerolineae bacterium]
MLDKLASLSEERGEDVSVILGRALKVGIEHLWRESILDAFLSGRASRDEAIRSVGLEWVELSEATQQAVTEDIRWARAA